MFPNVKPKDELRTSTKIRHKDQSFPKHNQQLYSPHNNRRVGSEKKLAMASTSIQGNKISKTDLLSKDSQSLYQEKMTLLMKKIRILHAANLEQIKNYEDLQTKSGFPIFYIYFSFVPLLQMGDCRQFLLDQSQKIRQGTCSFQKISIAIKFRNDCLQKWSHSLQKLTMLNFAKLKQQIYSKKATWQSDVNDLRLFTANLIDQVKAWRNQLGNTQEKALYLTSDNKNILIQILNDNKFIFSSKLAKLINFGQKNDPFLLAPLKKAEGASNKQLLEIIGDERDMVFFQKYMDYLAQEKIYYCEQNYETPKKKKSHSITQIYSSIPKFDEKEFTSEEQQDNEQINQQRNRQERLRKNKQKISLIKDIYDSSSNKKKNLSDRRTPQRKVDERELKAGNKAKKITNFVDLDFEKMLKQKKQNGKTKVQEKQKNYDDPLDSKNKKTISMTRLPKHEDRMMTNLKQMQESIKNKLQKAQSESLIDDSSVGYKKYFHKNNQELVEQLKVEIIEKIEREKKQKQRVWTKKKQEQQRVYQQMKLKMKGQMQVKLWQKKKEKMIQRQELQKKLKQEQDRINRQRQLQIQLSLKLNRQKQIRDYEKMRNKVLLKQQEYKNELQKQQGLTKTKQKQIENEILQNQKVIKELNKKQIRHQIEQVVRQQIAANKSSTNQQFLHQQIQEIKKQKQNELIIELQRLKYQQTNEMRQLNKETQMRETMLKIKKQQQEVKRKEIQQLMKSTIGDDKIDFNMDDLKKRIQLQESIKANVKQELLQQFNNQTIANIQQAKSKREIELEEQEYRIKVREKIEKQMRMQAIRKTQKQLQDRETKRYEMRTKLEVRKTNFEFENQIDKLKIEDQVKKDVIQKVVFDKNVEKENAKLALRAQFEKDLLCSAVPQIFQSKDNFMIKKTEIFTTEDYLMKKISEKTNNERPNQEQKQIGKSNVKDIKTVLTNEEMFIYTKQRNKIAEWRQDSEQQQNNLHFQEPRGFQHINPHRNYETNDLDQEIKVSTVENNNKGQIEKEQSKQATKMGVLNKQQQNSKAKTTNQKNKYSSQEGEMDKLGKQSGRKRSPNKSITFQQLDNSNKNIGRNKSKINFTQLNQQKQKQKVKNENFQQSKSKVSQKQQHFNKVQPITILKNSVVKQSNSSSKLQISLDAIPQDELQKFLQNHFDNLPSDQFHIQPSQREQLYKKLIGQLTFCLLLGHYENNLSGVAFAYHDRSKTDCRKFVIVHVGTYRSNDLKELILSLTNFIFKKDPCDEIEFTYHFDESNQQELSFSNDFNKWFDKYGNIYEKKLEDVKFERKYLLKRQFNQKCEVVLAGVNKNMFRNIFSVNAGVIMSESEMISYKPEMRDALFPENEVSYSILIAQLFRTYLTSDQAQTLKSKVKEFAKLRQLLILVVMLQKKKVKLDELKLYEYKSLIQLNMRLMSQGKDIVRFCKDSGIETNRIFYCQFNQAFNLPFNFQTTSLPVEIKQNHVKQISYFRLAALPSYKLHIIKSSTYNGEMNILPTENEKYKMFIMNAQQFLELKESNKVDLFMYIRLFLKNVKSHNVAVWKYVWMPEIMDKGAWSIREFKSFLNKDMYCHDSINISYRQFLPGALIIEPDHKDLVITPPFIVGIMNMTLEQVTEGCPLYARVVDVNALRVLELQ